MSDRERILDALPEGGRVLSMPDSPHLSSPPSGDLWEVFQHVLEGLGGRCIGRPALDGLAQKRVFIDENAQGFLSDMDFQPEPNPWSAAFGVTLAQFAIAETGSLVLEAGPERNRLASLCPEVHVCLVREDAIVATLDDALAKLSSRTSVIISGPSRTADIEGVLVHGAHGPRELWVLRV